MLCQAAAWLMLPIDVLVTVQGLEQILQAGLSLQQLFQLQSTRVYISQFRKQEREPKAADRDAFALQIASCVCKSPI